MSHLAYHIFIIFCFIPWLLIYCWGIYCTKMSNMWACPLCKGKLYHSIQEKVSRKLRSVPTPGPVASPQLGSEAPGPVASPQIGTEEPGSVASPQLQSEALSSSHLSSAFYFVAFMIDCDHIQKPVTTSWMAFGLPDLGPQFAFSNLRWYQRLGSGLYWHCWLDYSSSSSSLIKSAL